MVRGGSIYMMTNKNKTTLYVGVTSRLKERVYEHKSELSKKSFTFRYNLFHLVYFENFFSIDEAIARENELKKFTRKQKEELIIAFNPLWKDLYDELEE